jgi:hypothetical protein
MKKFTLSFSIIPVLLIFFFLQNNVTQAQNGFILSGFRDVQQSSYLNPAFTSGAHTVIGLPLISNFSTGLVTTAGGINDFFSKKAGSDSLYLDLTKVINNGQSQDKITEYLDNDILFAGFKAGNTFISLGVRQHVFVQTVLDRDLLRLFWNGNADYVNQTLNMSHTSVAEFHLMDYHIGVSIPAGKKFRIGVRFHILQGLSDISSENNGITMKTVRDNNGDFEFHAYTNFRLNTSGLPDSSDFDPGDYFLNFDNMGFSLDLGVDLQVTKQLWVNASFLNWGSVHYRKNTKSYYPSTDSVNFSGASVDLNKDNPFDHLGDTLQNLFDIKNEPRNYKIKLPTRFIVGVEYYTKDMRNDFSVLFSGRSFKEYFQPAVSAAYTRFVSPHFSVKAGYTWIKDAPVNIGLALAVNFSPFQFYLYSDNVPGLFQWDQQKYVQAGFGLNIRLAPRNTRKNPNNPEAITNLRPDIPK